MCTVEAYRYITNIGPDVERRLLDFRFIYLTCIYVSRNISLNSEGCSLKRMIIYNTCALSKHIGNMCMRLRNAGKGEASPSLFPRFANENQAIFFQHLVQYLYMQKKRRYVVQFEKCIRICNRKLLFKK
jgi:hypothetical protein